MSGSERRTISIPPSFVAKRMPSWLGNLVESVEGECGPRRNEERLQA